MSTYRVLVDGGFDSIDLDDIEEAKEYGFESNCRFKILNVVTNLIEYDSERGDYDYQNTCSFH